MARENYSKVTYLQPKHPFAYVGNAVIPGPWRQTHTVAEAHLAPGQSAAPVRSADSAAAFAAVTAAAAVATSVPDDDDGDDGAGVGPSNQAAQDGSEDALDELPGPVAAALEIQAERRVKYKKWKVDQLRRLAIRLYAMFCSVTCLRRSHMHRRLDTHVPVPPNSGRQKYTDERFLCIKKWWYVEHFSSLGWSLIPLSRPEKCPFMKFSLANMNQLRDVIARCPFEATAEMCEEALRAGSNEKQKRAGSSEKRKKRPSASVPARSGPSVSGSGTESSVPAQGENEQPSAAV